MQYCKGLLGSDADTLYDCKEKSIYLTVSENILKIAFTYCAMCFALHLFKINDALSARLVD